MRIVKIGRKNVPLCEGCGLRSSFHALGIKRCEESIRALLKGVSTKFLQEELAKRGVR